MHHIPGQSTSSPDTLPVPDVIAQAHSEKLIEFVRDEIAAQGGRISLARYMELVLYAPGLGYYSAGSRKFGAEGDFVTAPEISPLFSQALARQIQEVLSNLGGGNILEIGAGSGVMAAEILSTLEKRGQLPERYLLLELSADLRERQREAIVLRVPHLLDRVRWLDALPEAGFEGVIVANELLDALPVHGFHVAENGIQERFVTWCDDRFGWLLAEPESAKLIRALEVIVADLPVGYESEITLAAEAWISSLAAVLGRGVILLLDYGFPRYEYYHPQRNRGTLMCHYRHRSHDNPFVYPGLQDITAHVDFTSVAEAAFSAGLMVSGYNTQGFFLLANGLVELADAGDDQRQQLFVAQQIRTLTMPDQMGELFKVMALSRDFEAPLQGFSLQDLRGRL